MMALVRKTRTFLFFRYRKMRIYFKKNADKWRGELATNWARLGPGLA